MKTGTLAAGLAALWLVAAPARGQEGEAFFNQGLTHMREGRASMALESFKKAVKQDGKNPGSLRTHGQSPLGRREHDGTFD